MPCHREYHRAYRRRLMTRPGEREKINSYHRALKARQRKQTLDAYGHACSCCGESRYEFLAIDHVNGGGNKHRRSIGRRPEAFYAWLRKHGYPNEFRLLCHNCNVAIGMYGACPHTYVDTVIVAENCQA